MVVIGLIVSILTSSTGSDLASTTTASSDGAMAIGSTAGAKAIGAVSIEGANAANDPSEANLASAMIGEATSAIGATVSTVGVKAKLFPGNNQTCGAAHVAAIKAKKQICEGKRIRILCFAISGKAKTIFRFDYELMMSHH